MLLDITHKALVTRQLFLCAGTMNCPIALLLLLLAVFSYQPLGADGAVAFDYTKDMEVKKLAEEAANDFAALVLKILEKNGNAELVKVDRVPTPSNFALVTLHMRQPPCVCVCVEYTANS